MTRICGFCDKDADYFAYCDINLAVLACTKHIDYAKKSKILWLGQNNRVWFKHIKGEPLFSQTDVLDKDVVVKRSPKMVDGVLISNIDVDGWKIRTPFIMDGGAQVVLRIKGEWHINVVNQMLDAEKWIPLQDLKMSLEADKHGFVDELEAKLSANIYKAEMDAFVDAGSVFFSHNPLWTIPFAAKDACLLFPHL
jgi:hypothetical protein